MLSLRDEIARPAYAGMSDAEIAAALNGQTVRRRTEVPTSRVLSILLTTGDWGPLVLLSRRSPTGDAQTDALIAAAIVAVAAVERTSAFGTERQEDAEIVASMINAFVTAGVFRPATAERLLALMHEDAPVWAPAVTAEDVAIARGLPWPM